jgi:hypothetical protein
VSTRSFTDDLTNRTIFSSEELAQNLHTLADPAQRPPVAWLPTFLHEATHHWCFTSTVGTTLALLGMRARVRAFRAIEAATREEAEFLEKQAVDDLVRASVASQLLHPLAEGLACFAEFDLSVSNRSPVIPPPLRWLTMFFARDEQQGLPETRVRRRIRIAQQTAGALMTARRSERVYRAKEALLVEPLDCGASEGYLAGYLYVKAVWRHFQLHHERFNEPELLMLKLYDLFFEDFDFVKLLLDPSTSIPDALGPITQYLGDRLKYAMGGAKHSLEKFFISLSAARTELYDDETVEGRVLPLANPMDQNPAKRFRDLWQVIMGETALDLPDDRNSWTRSQQTLLSLNMLGHGRDLLELGSLAVTLDVAEQETTVEVGIQTPTRLFTVVGSHVGRVKGTLHLYLNTRSGEHIAAAAAADYTVVAIKRTPQRAYISDLRDVLGQITAPPIIQTLITQATPDLSKLKELNRINGYLQQSRSYLNSLYLPLGCNYVPTSSLEMLIPKLMTHGIYGAFDYDADAVRTLACIGSMAHLHVPAELVKAEVEKQGIDLDATLEKLRSYAKSTRLFWLSEGLGLQSSL